MTALTLHPVFLQELQSAIPPAVTQEVVELATLLSREPQESKEVMGMLSTDRARRVVALVALVLRAQDGTCINDCNRLLEFLPVSALTLGERYQLAECYSMIGRHHRQGQDLSGAVDVYQQGLRVIEGLPSRATNAALYHNIGVACEQSGDHLAAANAFDKSADLETELGHETTAIEERDRAVTNRTRIQFTAEQHVLGNILLGASQRQRGDMADALERFLFARKHALRSGDSDLVAMTAVNLAGIFFYQGELDRARDVLDEALKNAEGRASIRALTLVRAMLGNIMIGLHDLSSAEELLAGALELAYKGQWIESIDKCEYGLSEIAIQREDYEKAWQLLLRVLGQRRKQKQEVGVGNTGDVLVGNALNQLAFVADQLGRLREAKEYHCEALKVRRGHDLRGSGESAHSLAVIHEELNDKRLALAYFLRALRFYERIRKTISTGSDSRANFLEKIIEEYNDAARLASEMGRGWTVYWILQRIHNRTLVDDVATASVPPPAGIDDQAFRTEGELLSQLRSAAGNIHRTHDAVRQLASLYKRELRTTFSEYTRWRLGEPLPGRELLKRLTKLGPGTAYVELYEIRYRQGRNGEVTDFVGGVCARAGDSVIQPLGGSAQVPLGSPAAERIAVRSAWLPVLDGLQRMVGGPGDLFIVPHGHLMNLPLHALHTGNNRLIDLQAVRFLPHTSFLERLGWFPPRVLSDCVVFGDSQTNLPGSRDEAVEVANLLGTEAHLGSSVTRGRVMDALCNADLVHIAGHAFFDSKDPLKSGICVSNGHLTADDLRVVQMRATMVVLNACETGIHGKGLGHEISGFVRYLLLGGVSYVVCTVERVQDQVAWRFAKDLYDLLPCEPTDIPKAVAQAQRTLANAYSAKPELWTPFILVG